VRKVARDAACPLRREGKARAIGGTELAQLAVLATAAVVSAKRCLLVLLGLALNAQAHPGHRFAACLGNLGATGLATLQAFTPGQSLSRTTDRIIDGRVNLVLHRTVAGKAAGHQLNSHGTFILQV
jgi:hypothetical protein